MWRAASLHKGNWGVALDGHCMALLFRVGRLSDKGWHRGVTYSSTGPARAVSHSLSIIPILKVGLFNIVTAGDLMFSTIKSPVLTLNIWGTKRRRRELGVSLMVLEMHTNLLSAVCIAGISLIDRNWNPILCSLLALSRLSQFREVNTSVLFFLIWLKWSRNVKMKGMFERSCNLPTEEGYTLLINSYIISEIIH